MASTTDNTCTSIVSLTEQQKLFMEKAFFYANEALHNQEVPVGCIFVHDNQILSVGRNEVNQTRNATRHAEMICIDQVVNHCKRNSLSPNELFPSVDVYVTVEPCIMCAAALYNLKIKSVTFGCQNDRFGGSTVFNVREVLRAETEVQGGYKANEAMGLLKVFYKGQNPNAPNAKVKKKGGGEGCV